MRSPTSGLAATLTAVISAPGYLLKIDLPSMTLRICSFATGFSFDGFTWQGADVIINGISWQSGGQAGGSVVFGDVDMLFWSYALNLQLQDAPVSIWACDKGAPNEAEPIWYGNIGEVVRSDGQTSCSLVPVSELPQVPRRRCQQLVPSYLLIPAGTVIDVGGQKWIIDRQFDATRTAYSSTTARDRTRRKIPRTITRTFRQYKGR